MGSIALGVAALVAIHSFRADVEHSLDDQDRVLLGADVRVSSSRAFPEEFEAVLDSMVGEGRQIARTTMLASMVLDTRSEGVRLFQIRAVDPGFPFYGDVASEPSRDWAQIHDGPWAVADPALEALNPRSVRRPAAARPLAPRSPLSCRRRSGPESDPARGPSKSSSPGPAPRPRLSPADVRRRRRARR